MQIHVLGLSAVLTDQTRAYAEYRMFSRMAPLAADVGSVLVVLTRDDERGETECVASAEAAGERVRARARHPHPTAAIDAAAEKLVAAARKRLFPASTA